MEQPDNIQVKIYAPFKVYFNGLAKSFSGFNDTGPFDILARHKNFMCLLRPGEARVRRQGQKDFAMHINQGILHVKNNKVTVFLDV